MRIWTSVHGMRACKQHGMKRGEAYVSHDDTTLSVLRGRRGVEVHVVGGIVPPELEALEDVYEITFIMHTERDCPCGA